MSGRRIDPVTFEVVTNALASLADEMALTVMRTAYSGVVKDAMDYSTGFCDRNGDIIAQGLTIVVHLGSFPGAVKNILDRYRGRINPGDVFILNDPYGSAGIHLPDIYVFKPVFCSGSLEGFACALAHHTDVGGIVPGSNSTSSTEIYQEGLRIPALKLYEAGVANEAIFALIEKNVRVPDKVLGDLRATLAALATGEKAYQELAGRYGAKRLREYTDELIDYSERLARAEIAELPDGRYEFADHVEADGSEAGEVTIQVAVTIAGDHVLVDFTGTSPQVKAGINSPIAFTRSATCGAIRMLLDPAIPNSAGYFRAIEVVAPEGTVVNPVLPGACGARGITGFRIMDAVLGALAQAVPDRVPADGEGGNSIVSIGGYEESFRPFVYVDLLAGARGGSPWGDGAESVPHPASNIANTPIELIEVDLPLRVEEYGLVPGSAGAGRHRGALAQVRTVRLLGAEATLQIRSDKRAHRPWGLAGGQPGSPSLNILNPGAGERLLPTLNNSTIRQGDVVRHVLASGAGWGDPFERDPEAVRLDVWNEKLTAEQAAREYRVVVDAQGLEVDFEATRRLRRSCG